MTKNEMLNVLGQSDNSKIEIENCKIANVYFGFEEHGILTLNLVLEGDCWGVVFGNCRMDGNNVNGPDYPNGMDVVKDLLNTFEVKSLDELEGSYCRCINEGLGGKALAIGHITKNRFFSFEESFARPKKEKA